MAVPQCASVYDVLSVLVENSTLGVNDQSSVQANIATLATNAGDSNTDNPG